METFRVTGFETSIAEMAIDDRFHRKGACKKRFSVEVFPSPLHKGLWQWSVMEPDRQVSTGEERTWRGAFVRGSLELVRYLDVPGEFEIGFRRHDATVPDPHSELDVAYDVAESEMP